MPKKRIPKGSNGHRKTVSKPRATPSPTPTPTPPATDIPPAPQTVPETQPNSEPEPNNNVEMTEPATISTTTTTTTAPASSYDENPEDSTVLVERPSENGDDVQEEQLIEELAEQPVPEPVADPVVEQEIAHELVDLVQSIAESEVESVEASVQSSSDNGFPTTSEAVAEVTEVAQQESSAVEGILLNSAESSVPATPPRKTGSAEPQHQHHEHSSPESAPHHLRRAASTSFVASSISTSPSSHGRHAHKHLRFTSTDADSECEHNSHHLYYPRKGANISDPGTPNLAETAHQIRRTISFASLDNLVQLQKDPDHRERFVAEVARAGRDLVWRDKDDHPLYPRDGEQTFVLASKRALRSFILAFTVRSGVNVVLLLLKALGRRKKVTIALLRSALLGEDSWRFGAMIGSFTFLNTLVYHLLRLAPPPSYVRKRLRAGLFSQPTFGPPVREGAEGEHRWHAAAAGGIASLALLWETEGRRRGVSQQMVVRGLQGAWNQYTPQAGVHIPFGNIVLFGLCCGQIMFGFLLAPETIPRDYYNWIQSVSGVPTFAVASNRTAVRENLIHPEHVKLALASRGVTKGNQAKLLDLLERIKGGAKADRHIPCSITHPWTESCSWTIFERFFQTFRFMLPVYGALHLIPPIVLKRHAFAKAPLRMLLRIVIGISRSCSFLGFFIIINQWLFCMRTRAMDAASVPVFIKKLIARKETFWVMGFLNALSLFAEERKRRTELAMYVFPKALEGAWAAARKRAWVPVVPFGDTILGASAMAMVMDSYVHSPESLSGIVRRLLFQLVGPV